MGTSVLEEFGHPGQQSACSAHAAQAAVSAAVDEGKAAAKRLLRRARNSAEDVADQASQEIRHNPGRSVALAFGAGAFLGSICGLMLGRITKN